MTMALIIFSGLIILTKLADCYTTSNQINNNYSFEKNPLTRFLMKRIGVQQTIWLTFIFAIFITIISLISVIEADSILYDLIFITIAAMVSIVQFFVALHNHTKNQNFLTKILYKIYN